MGPFIYLPKLFDDKSHLLKFRASKNWWHPQFDSHILEQQYWKSLLPRTTKRFQFGLFYLALMSGVYCVYFGVMGISERLTFFLIFLLVFVSVISILLVTFLKRFFYQNHCFKISLVLSLVLCSASLIGKIKPMSSFDTTSHFEAPLQKSDFTNILHFF